MLAVIAAAAINRSGQFYTPLQYGQGGRI